MLNSTHRYAILIDGGFIKHKLGSKEKPVDDKRIRSFISKLATHDDLVEGTLHRVFYYDSLPLENSVQKPLMGGTHNFGKTSIARDGKKILDELRYGSYTMALRLGELEFRGWNINPRLLKANGKNTELTVSADDFRPIVQQKGVDMRIGLDIAALTLKKHVDVIVLITGDSDFVPAMKFARREGAQLFLVTLGHGVKPAMHEHSDFIISDMDTEWKDWTDQ